MRFEEDRLQCGVRVLRGVLNDVGYQPDGLLGQGRHQDAEVVLLIGDAAEVKLSLRHCEPLGRCVTPEERELEAGSSIVVRSCSWFGHGGRVLIH